MGFILKYLHTKLIIVIALLMVLTACVSTTLPPVVDGAPASNQEFEVLPEPTPRWEPRSRAGNKSPYTVLGKTYYVLRDSQGYKEKGIASWYGTKFHGRKTSNGETYNMYDMTAAHKSLPIPTFVRVTNLDNGREIIVRVNDRGPFHDDRLIDLSFAAAKKLGFDKKGTTDVLVTAITPGSAQRSVSAMVAKNKIPSPTNPLFLQVGAFGNLQAANSLKQRLDKLVNESVVVKQENKGSILYKVRVGPVVTANSMQRILNILELANLGAPLILDSSSNSQ